MSRSDGSKARPEVSATTLVSLTRFQSRAATACRISAAILSAAVIGSAMFRPCIAADKSGVGPNTISVPKGPGSIEGLGESFQPTLNTGTAKYAIGLKLPPGTARHAPSLGLNYEGGGANGPLGYGWSLPIPSIQRRTDHGIPTYGQDVGFPRQDTFINEMKEELVPQTNGYYFCQNEGAFIRYQPLAGHWEATLPNGTRLLFGLSSDTRIQNGTNDQVFAWLLEQQIDTHGNTITYSYSSFPDEHNLNQKYLTAIRYGPGPAPWSSFHFVTFQYEDRPDWFEDCRSGFSVRTGKRLKTIRVGTQGVSLAGHLQGDFDGDGSADYLDRAYQLEYLDYAGTNSHWSLLAKVTPLGADGTNTLPSSSFGYALSDPPDSLSAADQLIGGTNEPPLVMDNSLVDLVDLNGDGLPDILKTDANGGAHQAFLNRGQVQTPSGPLIQWDSPVDVDPGGGAAWSYNLGSVDTHLADMDGDGLADLVHKSILGDVIYFPNLGHSAWGPQQLMSSQDSAPPSPFGEVDVRTADLDFDKRIDIIQSVASGVGFSYRIWFNLGNQTYSPAITVDQDNGFSLADPAVQLADLNGDRLPDLARIQPAGVTVTAGLGYGHFAAALFMPLPDETLSDTQVSRAKLTDLNGDGLADLVIERAAPGQCWYWLNLGNYSWSNRKVITGLPTAIGQNAVVRWADLNGNGTTDLLYADHDSSPRIQAVDLGLLLAGATTPNVLTTISNGLGRVTLIQYQPSTVFSLADAAAGAPWTNLMPLVVSVVAGVTTLDSLGHSYLTRFQYHDGYYDPVEKQFRGFGRVEQVDVGDATAPTLVTRSFFDTGQNYETMKGKLLRVTTLQEDGKVFTDASTAWTVPPVVLMVGTNGTNVSYAHPVSTLTQVQELGQGTARTLEQEFEFDNYGNETRLADYGIVENADRSAFNDERITTTQYAINTNKWLLRFPARQQIQDENGAVISRVESYYDDEAFSGNNLGMVEVGNVTLTRAWITPSNSSAFVFASRSKYDGYGNPTTLLDPLGVAPGGAVSVDSGHVREIGYDASFHAFPVSEAIYVGTNGLATPLVYVAAFDEGFGTMVSSTDFNTNTTLYGYDVFARLVSMTKPYDSPAYPTMEYDYSLAVPFGANGLINFVETRELDKPPGTGANKRDAYFISRSFTDGLGRTLMTKEEAEPAPGSTTPRVVVNAAVLFNSRQKVSRALNPFFTLQPGVALDSLLNFEDIEAPGWKGAFHQDGQLQPL
ncbi:MAG TPA: toxin TcdB middle/N-terminal domain-containing protein, partial [Verrucomicrobiae bacterium]|nr:toxin TcdB middle/N-terminal domain-containing protein [Verrucomicrobiae bacterium]